jgi:NADPH:quinone reductase-like Zn-dependent oxidoreductase
VTRFKKDDKVVTVFNQGHLAGSLDAQTLATGLGGKVDGVLRQYGAFDENGLVHMPSNLNFLEASTLPCAPVTAWNALYGLKELKPGDWVLTQGTGGVSVTALQFAKAAGARVIATTSSSEKAAKLRKLGADHIINYKEDAKWGETAKKLTGGRGVQYVLEVGGPTTMKQSFNAIAIDGIISIIGFLGGVKVENPPTFLDNLNHICIVRGVLVGSREQMEAMNRAIEANNIKPVVDEKVFKLEEAKDAYQVSLLRYIQDRGTTDGE